MLGHKISEDTVANKVHFMYNVANQTQETLSLLLKQVKELKIQSAYT